MGKLPNGMFGGINGSAGNLTSYVLNGQNVVRIRHRKIKRFSENQLANQQRMAVINAFSNKMLPFLKVGFSNLAIGTTKNYHNLATAYNKKHALKGEYPNIEIDYQKVLISSGELMMPENPKVALIGDELKFSWDPVAGYSTPACDQVMAVAFGTVSKTVAGVLYGPQRSEGEFIIKLVHTLLTEPLETYMSFVTQDRTAVSNSVYLGRIDPATI